MTGHLRIKSPNTQLGVLLLVYFIPQLLLASLSRVIFGGKIDLSAPENIATMKWVQAASSLVFFFLPALLFALFSFRGKYFYFLGFKQAEKTSMYVLGIGCMLLAFPLVFWLGELNQRVPMPASMIEMEKQAAKQMEAFLKVNGPGDIIINVIVIALLPAICEEMFFRGAMQRVIIQLTKRPWVGIVVTAALFSALHFQFQGFLPRMFLGVLLGALYWFSGSLWTSIVAHFITNAVQVLVASYATKYINENPAVPFYLALISAVAVFGILRLYQRLSTITWSKVYDRNGLTPHNNYIA
ncbi:MAG: CPBP family intramembrane metalloprotease [Chitinophagaceae bacterium]|nr:MAG: CPBP family intramembrane metalloprotease [Chitinophagaceae bacterium]